MEIRKINNEIINEYPKLNEFKKKKFLKKSIQIGISSFVFKILTKSKVYSMTLDGDQISTHYYFVNPKYEMLNNGLGFFKVLSILLSILSLILTKIKKYKNKKGLNTKLTNKKMTILYIATVLSIIIFVIIMIILNQVPEYMRIGLAR